MKSTGKNLNTKIVKSWHKKGVRKHEDYMKNYFVSQYGAIKDIDFTPIFEEILASEGEA